MGVAEASQREVEKKCYRNQTAGWVGIVKLDHLGAQVGHPVAPYGSVWLTDDEAVLTARAPALPQDNPFVAKEFDFQNNETGEIVKQEMAPLVLVEADGDPDDERYVPKSPILGPDGAKIEADRAQAEAAIEGHDPEERPVPSATVEPTLAASSTAAVPPSHSRPGAPTTDRPFEAEVDQGGRDAWLPEPGEVSEEPQPGTLGGAAALNEDDGGQQTAPSPAATATVESPLPGANAEEHAAHTESGEETGAADTPAGAPAEGEFAAHEEVGSPEAPAQGQES